MIRVFLVAFAIVFFSAVNAQAKSPNIKASDHAPIGVMRDHFHRQGEFMARR